jgi:hypothetical protein
MHTSRTRGQAWRRQQHNNIARLNALNAFAINKENGGSVRSWSCRRRAARLKDGGGVWWCDMSWQIWRVVKNAWL